MFRNIALIAVITIFIKVLAFYKEALIASTLGLSEVLDTFLIAILVPTFINSVFLNSFKTVFIPNYLVEISRNGNKASFQSVIFLITIIVSLLSVFLAFLSTDVFLELIYPGHSESYYRLVKDQLYIILPCLLLWGISSLFAGLLEIENKFIITAPTEIFPIITMIIFLIFFTEQFEHLVLAYGTLTGSLLGFIFLLYFTIKNKVLILSQPSMNDNTKAMLRQLPPKISSSFLTAMNNYVDQFFAAQLVVGSISSLNYGAKIPAFGTTIVITALGTVLLPHFSRLATENLKESYHLLFKILKLIVGIGICIVIVIMFASDWLIQILFERGSFTHADTLKVSSIQKILLLYVPFFICNQVIVRFLTSINKNVFMAWASLANLILNIILNSILVRYYGVFGLAISTSLILIISSFFYFGYTYQQYKISFYEN